MAATKVLFCERKLDAVVLGAVCSGLGAVIRPVGGKGHLRAYVEGYVQGRPVSFVAVRDRDFDREPDSAGPDLCDEGGNVFCWGRHEIENYLLETTVLALVYERIRSWPALRHLPVRGQSEIVLCLDQAAEHIRYFQAARWALGQLRPSGGWPRVQTRWVREPMLPNLDEGTCRRAAWDEAAHYQQVAGMISAAQAAQLFDRYSAKFSDPSFFVNRHYLVWFSGKDLFAAFLKTVGIPLNQSFYDGLLNVAAQELSNLPPQDLPANFRELLNRVERLSA